MKKILRNLTIIMLPILAIVLGVIIAQAAPSSQAVQPTYTPDPTYTPWATFTSCASSTPTITITPTPTFTPTPYPTSTPYPTQTQYPDQFCEVEPPTGGEEYHYVSLNGNDANTGTINAPWRTIQRAANSVVAGETVLISAGNYDERVQINNSGELGARISYVADGTVTMKGFTVRADHITIEGFDITDTENGWSEGWGIFIEGSYCVIENNYVYFAIRGGIILYNNIDDPLTNNCVVKDNRLHRNAMVGIMVMGRDNLIEGNEIWGTIQYHPNNPSNRTDADGIRFFGSEHTIRRNHIHDITFDDPENINPHIDCFQTWEDNTHEAASDIIFEQNICEVLENQVARENGHGFMLEDASNLTIRNNIIKAYGGISAYGCTNTGGSTNSHLTIVNNIFVNDLSFQPYPAGIGLVDCPYTIVKNNIFYNQPYHTISVTGSRSGQEIDYNLAYRSDSQPSRCYTIEYSCVDPAPAHDLWDVDPLLNADYTLQVGSPAIDAGIDVGLPYNGSAPDMGTFEQ